MESQIKNKKTGVIYTITDEELELISTTDIANSFWLGSENFPIETQTKKSLEFQTLTDASTINFDVNKGLNAKVTLAGNRTLALNNALNGDSGKLIIKQDGTGNRTLALPASCRVFGGGAGAVDLTNAANSQDILIWFKENDIIYFIVELNATAA